MTTDTPPALDSDTSHDQYTPLRAVNLRSGRGAKRVHVATLYRWTERGCRGVRLRYVQVGATRCTTREWLDEFFAELTAKSAGQPATPAPPRTTAARRRAIAVADRELERMG